MWFPFISLSDILAGMLNRSNVDLLSLHHRREGSLPFCFIRKYSRLRTKCVHGYKMATSILMCLAEE
jgi:hypothetical protein